MGRSGLTWRPLPQEQQQSQHREDAAACYRYVSYVEHSEAAAGDHVGDIAQYEPVRKIGDASRCDERQKYGYQNMSGPCLRYDDGQADDDKQRGKQYSDIPVALEHAERSSGISYIIQTQPVSDERNALTGLHVCPYKVFRYLIGCYHKQRDQRVHVLFHRCQV